MSQTEATNHKIPPFTKAAPLLMSMFGKTQLLVICLLLMHQKTESHT